MTTTYDASYSRVASATTATVYDDNHLMSVSPKSDTTSTTLPGGGSQQSLLNLGVDMAGVLVKAGQTFVNHQRGLNTSCGDYSGGTPAVLRFLCFLGGLTLAFTNTLAVMNIFTLLTSPPVYVLQAYQLLFGLIIMTLEGHWDFLDPMKPYINEWFRFLTHPSGRGAFYLFVGSLGVSLWLRSFASFINGLYMAAMGIACLTLPSGGTRYMPEDEEEEDDYDDDYDDGMIGDSYLRP